MAVAVAVAVARAAAIQLAAAREAEEASRQVAPAAAEANFLAQQVAAYLAKGVVVSAAEQRAAATARTLPLAAAQAATAEEQEEAAGLDPSSCLNQLCLQALQQCKRGAIAVQLTMPRLAKLSL